MPMYNISKVKRLKKEEMCLEKTRLEKKEKELHKEKLRQEKLIQENFHKQKLFQEKLKLKCIRTCIATKESQETQKLRRKFLDERLSDLQYEKDICKSISQFSLLDFLTNPDDTSNDHLLSFVESNQLPNEKNKHGQEFGESSSKNHAPKEKYENLEDIADDFLESFVNGNFRSKLILKVSPSKNFTDVISTDTDANPSSLEHIPQWNFDYLYEEIS